MNVEREIKRVRAGAIKPELVYGGRVWKFFCPVDFSGIVLPTCDLLIPTGWDIEDLEMEYLPQLFSGTTYPSNDEEIGWDGGGKLLIMSPWIRQHELYIHVINLGNNELKVKPEKPIAYLCFTKITCFDKEDLEICFTG